MSAIERLDIFTPFLAKGRDPESGVLMVEGVITGPGLDSDLQRMSPDFLSRSVPAWYKIGNIREQHRADSAVGKAVELWDTDDGNWHIRAKIVDKAAALKVEHGVYTGFSIGIQRPRIVKSADASGGMITDGEIVETSICDRGSYPDARLAIAKSINGQPLDDVDQVEEIADEASDLAKASTVEEVMAAVEFLAKTAEPTVVANPDDPDAADPEALAKAFGDKKAPPFDKDGKPQKKDDAEDGEDSDDAEDGDGGKPAGKKKAAEKAAALDVDAVVKAVLAELEKRQFTAAERDDAADAGHALPDGSFPIKTRADLKNAISSYGRAKDKDAAKAHIIARAKVLGAEAELPDGWKPSASKAAIAELTKDDSPSANAGDLQLTDDDAANAEMDDIAAAKAVVQGLAHLICSEAMGLALGDLSEVADIALLTQCAELVKWFMEREAAEIKHLVEPADTEGGALEMAANPELIKAAEDAAASFRERLEKAAAPAEPTQASADQAETDTIDANVLTKAITGQVTAAVAGQFGDALTKAMGPVMDRLAQVEATLAATPRGGGPAVTAVRPVADQADLTKAAKIIGWERSAELAEANGEAILARGYRERIKAARAT